MDDMVATLWNSYIALMAIGAWFVVWVLQKVFMIFNTNYWLRKLKPLYAVVLCQGFVWIPGAMAAGAGWGERVLVGFWCGFLASFGYQIAKRILEPRGINLPDDPDKLTQAVAPKVEEPKAEESKEASSSTPDELTPAETPAAKGSTPPPKPVEPEEKA
jgi:hypothetical protein